MSGADRIFAMVVGGAPAWNEAYSAVRRLKRATKRPLNREYGRFLEGD
jgi:hypothetical protein